MCVFICGMSWCIKGRILQIWRGFQEIEKSRRKICCPQKGRGGKRERRNCGMESQSRRVRRGKKFKIQGRVWRCIPRGIIGLSVRSITRISREPWSRYFWRKWALFSRQVWGEINCGLYPHNNWNVSLLNFSSLARFLRLALCLFRLLLKFFLVSAHDVEGEDNSKEKGGRDRFSKNYGLILGRVIVGYLRRFIA